MDRITLNEGIAVLLAERDGVDGTNVIGLLRTARSRIESVWGHFDFDRLRDADEVDAILIRASGNGDLFA